MRRPLRIALIIIAVPLVLAVLLWVGLRTVGNTVWGRQQIETLVARLTHNHVRLAGLGGDLPDRVSLRELQLADAHGIWLTAQNLEGTWHPWALLERRVAVDTAHAQRIDWLRLPIASSPSNKPAHIPHIDVLQVSADAVNLGAALVVTPATLNVHGAAHLRSIEDMQFAFAATRLGGVGTYSAQVAFNRRRMDGAFNLREPAHGPLAGLFGVAAIGAVQIAGDLSGPRQQEHVTLQANLGDLHVTASGSLDLTHQAADLTYAADAPAMALRDNLSWQRLHVRGTWHGSLATASAAGEVQALALLLPNGVEVGSLDASLEAHSGDLGVHARIANARVPGMPVDLLGDVPLAVDGSIRFALASRPFALQVSHPKFTLQAKGQWAGTRAVTADLEVKNVAALLQPAPAGLLGPLHAHATAQFMGAKVQVRLTGTGNLDSTIASLHPWLRGALTADVRGSYEAGVVKLDEVTVANPALNVTLSGRITAPKTHGGSWGVAGKSRAALADLSLVLPALSGQANARADLSGSIAALRLAGDLKASVAVRNSAPGSIAATFDLADLTHAPHAAIQVRGDLARQPVMVRAELQMVPGQSLHIGLPQADWQSLHAQGDITLTLQDLDRSQGQLKWSFADLGELNSLLGLHLAGGLAGDVTLVPGAQGSRLQVTSDGLEIAGMKVNATLSGSGPLHALQLALTAQSSLLGKPAHLAAQGLLNAEHSIVQLTDITAQVRGVDVKLLQPATLDYAHGLALSGLRASLADATLTAAGEIQPQLQLNAELTDATPGLIDALLPGYLASGKLQGKLQLQGSLAHPEGQLRLTGTDLRGAGDGASLPPAQLLATVELAADTARIQLQSAAGESSHMTVAGTIARNGPIAVDLNGIVDLTRLNPLLESIGRRITGTVDVNAQVAGTIDAPTVKGTVQLHKGSIHDYRHGFDLTQIEGTLQGTENELQITQLNARAASGTVAVTGTLGVLQGGWPLNLHFTAHDAQPFTSSIVTGTVNADLTLQGTALHELTLAGNVDINKATVEIPNSFPPNVAVLEVRRPGEQLAPPTGNGPIFNLKVTVNAPRQILVKGRGLDAELGGKIAIGGTARAPSVDGGFDLQRGQFTLAGSRLSFQSGRVSFAGSDVTGKIDPTLDFTAQASALDTTVTLRITGVADAPQFELTSVPSLPQDEILARLLFGETAGQLTAIQAAQLGAALVTLTGVGGGVNPLVELQKHLGLDRLAVGSNDTGQPGSTQNNGATIEAGRYVTNRIFVDLKQNTTGSTQLQVDVDLTNKLKLQTRLGNGTATVQGTTPDNDPGSSVGLSYRFEY